MTTLRSHLKTLASDERGSITIASPNYHVHVPDRKVMEHHTKQQARSVWFYGYRLLGYIRMHHIVAVAALLGLATLSYGIHFITPRTIQYSFGSQACFTNPLILPNTTLPAVTGAFDAQVTRDLTVAGIPLYSHTTCVQQIKPVDTGASTQQIALRASLLPIIQKSITVTTPHLPSVQPTESLARISTKDPIRLTLSEPDTTHAYAIHANKASAQCIVNNTEVVCPVAPLKLSQSQDYSVDVRRLFLGTEIETVLSADVATVEAVRVTKSSITNKKLIYTNPKTLTLATNKPVEKIHGARLSTTVGKETRQIPINTSHNGQEITIRFSEALPRSASLTLTIDDISAADQGRLKQPYALTFKTSGGPIATSSNLGAYGFGRNNSVYITFDVGLSTKQSAQSFVTLSAGGKTLSATSSISGNQIIINPDSTLPRCTSITVSITAGLVSTYGIDNGEAKTFTGRSLCSAVGSIGVSHQGRGLTSYSFGSGSQYVVFVGGTHGDEASSSYILNSWIDYLEANAQAIPANKTIVIIPQINPDGLAAGTRVNAKNVDLNRNFPANNWKKDVIMPDGTLNKGGGGSAPLSEPESSALANFILSKSPKLVMTYHAVGGMVIANESGKSMSLANKYGSLTSYSVLGNSQIGNIFNYDTTGAFEDWLHDGPGIPAILVELWSYTGNEFWSHQSAMWAMVADS